MEKKSRWRVLVVGAGSPNADMVAEVLNAHGVSSAWTDRVRTPDPRLIGRFDVIYGIYLQTCSRYILLAKLLGKKTIVHFVGSDAYWVLREKSLLRQLYWDLVLSLTDALLYVSPHLEDMVGRKGFIMPFPIDTEQFKRPELRKISPARDILYYCPSGSANEQIYRRSWILEYARTHPNEKITIIGNIAHPARSEPELSNVQVIPFVERSEMPLLYRKHRRLIRMTTEDGLPRMVHEAILCGLSVTFNGEEAREVPKEREPTEFASGFRNVLDSLYEGS